MKNKLYSRAAKLQGEVNPLSVWYHMRLRNFSTFLEEDLLMLHHRTKAECKEMFNALCMNRLRKEMNAWIPHIHSAIFVSD